MSDYGQSKMKTIELNEEQSAVIESKSSKKLIVAGPGSGKTALLVSAIAAACEGPNGIPFENIVAITYTNAAASELESRLRRHFLDDNLLLGFCGTLHAFLLRLLRESGTEVGLPANLSVIDDDQREGLVQQIAEEMGIKCSLSKALEMLDRRQVAFHSSYVLSKEDLVAKEYRLRLKKGGLLDFDSILEFGFMLLSQTKAEEWPYSCLFVDELQDAAEMDFEIYEAMPCANKFMVGDPDQAIFGFRGGNSKHMVETAEKCSNPKTVEAGYEVFTLETNYRCGARLCEAAQSLIEHNVNRFSKATIATHDTTDIVAYECEDGEPHYVHGSIMGLVSISDSDYLNEVAILCRTNRLAKEFAQHLKAFGIPVAEQKYGYVPPDWKLAKLLLSVLQAPWNDLLLERYLDLRDGGCKTAKREAAEGLISINEWCKFQFGHGDCTPSSLDADLAKHAITDEARERIHDAASELSKRNNRWTLNDLLIYLNTQEEASLEVGEGVTVTTIHQSKGREWDCVFLPGCEEGIIPSKQAVKKFADICAIDVNGPLEEERRLFYVGMTRARSRLFITWCAHRPEYRGPNLPPGPMQKCERSRFIAEAGL